MFLLLKVLAWPVAEPNLEARVTQNVMFILKAWPIFLHTTASCILRNLVKKSINSDDY